jgi:hypothetical protein
MKTLLILISLSITISIHSEEKKVPQEISEDTQTCIDCHESITPGIVADWVKSRHSKSSLQNAMAKPELKRRVSITNLPEMESGNYIIGCYECHSLRPDQHADNFEHFGYNINVIVSPKDCETCHPEEVEQYSGSKKYHAIDNLRDNPLYSTLVETITGVKEIKEKEIKGLPASHLTKGETCYACHGTEIKVEGMKTVVTDLDDIEVPNLTNWPNHGVGRINPDGSRGACTSCHPRHSFSIEIARKPYTCGQCHLEPDVPAYNVYMESKHGNIFDSMKEKYEFDSVPWIVGKDFNAPTCATCHNSLVMTLEGEIISKRTHNFGDRLWTRIFGLIYSHPQPKSGNTSIIKNADGLPLPTTFGGQPASEFLISVEEQDERMEKMSNVCKACHSTSHTEAQLAKIESVNREADQMVKAATEIMSDIWNKKIEDKENPFDEQIEILWQRQWLFYANSVRYGTAMMGPDYAAFKNGWWELSQTLQKMKDMGELKGNK